MPNYILYNVLNLGLAKQSKLQFDHNDIRVLVSFLENLIGNSIRVKNLHQLRVRRLEVIDLWLSRTVQPFLNEKYYSVLTQLPLPLTPLIGMGMGFWNLELRISTFYQLPILPSTSCWPHGLALSLLILCYWFHFLHYDVGHDHKCLNLNKK